MKDETAGKPIKEFVGLRSKMYSLLVDGKEKKTAKGIKKSVIRRDLCHAAYRDVLLNEAVTEATMNLIRSHNLMTNAMFLTTRCILAHMDIILTILSVLWKMTENKVILVI